MRVGIVPCPLMPLRHPAVQIQIRESLRALAGLGLYQNQALTVVHAGHDGARLGSCDVVHVFGTGGANVELIDSAIAQQVPVVLSPMVPAGWRAQEIGAGADGRDRALRHALGQAALVVALGCHERRAVAGALGDSSRLRMLGTGIYPAQFHADGALFRARTGITTPFVLVDGPVAPSFAPLALARALPIPLLLLGEMRELAPPALRELLALPGVSCLGGLHQDPAMLASAYAAAAALVLPSQGDCTTRTVLDALAAGTPVVLSAASAIDVPDDCALLRQVRPGAHAARAAALLAQLALAPARERVRALVRPYSWERTALQLAGCYAAAIARGAALAA